MAKLDGLATVLDSHKGLQSKIAAQISKKVLSLNIDPLPADSKELVGYSGYYRVDMGQDDFILRSRRTKCIGTVFVLLHEFQQEQHLSSPLETPMAY
ncbi:MAG: hypothetical protein MUF49_11115 [Oculatellaceae cyanobacterium Prado106]|jgi:hypothetical protein|nr:hypothetical protein [Oculatellaceae cyanobacterium Prado106]